MTAAPLEPAYLALHRSGALAERARAAVARLADCDLCARVCRSDRVHRTVGAVCRTGRHAIVSSFFAHHGEERCLSGTGGSGTIFFDQYRPCYRAAEHPELARPTTRGELRAAADAARRAGLTRLDPDGVRPET